MAINSERELSFLYLPYLFSFVGGTLLMGVLNALILLPMQYIPISTTCFLLPCLVMIATMLAFNFEVFANFESNNYRASPGAYAVGIAFPFTCTVQFWMAKAWFGYPYIPDLNFFLLAIAGFIVPNLIWVLACTFSRRMGLWARHTYEGLSSIEVINKFIRDIPLGFSLLIPSKRYRFIPIVVNCNLCIALAMLIGGVHALRPLWNDLWLFGATITKIRPLEAIDHWRFLTAGWVHMTFPSMVLAAAGLILVGKPAERILGAGPVATIYLTSLLSGHVVNYYLHTQGNFAGSYFGTIGLVGALFFYAFFDIGDESNRGKFIFAFIGGGALALLANSVDASVSGYMNIPGISAAFMTGIAIAIYYIPALRAAPSDDD